MKKIGFTTLIYNYGSVLQCYATKYLISKRGVSCDYINYTGYTPRYYRLFIFFKKNHPSNYILEDYFKDQKFQNFKNEFVKKEIKPKTFSYKTLKILNNYYDHYIIGSDQVWNFNSGVSFFPLLTFAKKGKCSSFASSFGNGHLGCSHHLLRKSLSRFKCLSVREASGVNIIRNIVHKKVELLPDPVVGLTNKEWRIFYKNNVSLEKKDYILLHFLNKPNHHTLSLIESFTNRSTFHIICFFGNYGYFDNLENVEYIDGSPYDYLYLIDNAKYVLTDSFHSAQFAIIFEKQFFIFERNYLMLSQNDRIIELINKYDCHLSYVDKDIKYLDPNVPLASQDNINFWKMKANNYLDILISNICDKNLIAKPIDCTNCGTCYRVCPTKSIESICFKKVFECKKIIKKSCDNCHDCHDKCFNRGIELSSYKKNSFLCYANKLTTESNDLSCSAFDTIAKYVINNHGVVFGPHLSFDGKKIICKTICVDKISDLPTILNNKYLECELDNCFNDIKNRLDSKQIVLVLSNSCKIKGLLNYLSKNYDNLITVDYVFCGTPSIKLFEKYLRYTERKIRGRIVDLKFIRKLKKESGIFLNAYEQVITFKRNELFFKLTVSQKDNLYMSDFIMKKTCRDKCYFCDYSSLAKPSDISLEDYRGFTNDRSSFLSKITECNNAPIDIIVVNTEKGKQVIDVLKEVSVLYPLSLKEVENYQSNAYSGLLYSKNNIRIRSVITKYGFVWYRFIVIVMAMYYKVRKMRGYYK